MDLLNDFKENVVMLLDELLNICQTTPELSDFHNKISTYKYFADKFINNYPEKVITQFILYVLPYKQKIDEGDEEFFLTDLAKTVGENNTVVEAVGEDYIRENNTILPNESMEQLMDDLSGIEIFRFKEIWDYLTDNNKACIKEYMQLLCYYADEYFASVYQNKAYA